MTNEEKSWYMRGYHAGRSGNQRGPITYEEMKMRGLDADALPRITEDLTAAIDGRLRDLLDVKAIMASNLESAQKHGIVQKLYPCVWAEHFTKLAEPTGDVKDSDKSDPERAA